jgi:hypothetical protein
VIDRGLAIAWRAKANQFSRKAVWTDVRWAGITATIRTVPFGERGIFLMDDLKISTTDFIFDASASGVIMTRVADGRWVAGTREVAAVYTKMLKAADPARRPMLLDLMFHALDPDA